MIVVADTTPLRYLVVIEREHLLPALYSRVLILCLWPSWTRSHNALLTDPSLAAPQCALGNSHFNPDLIPEWIYQTTRL
jgi:hypothetical protein